MSSKLLNHSLMLSNSLYPLTLQYVVQPESLKGKHACTCSTERAALSAVLWYSQVLLFSSAELAKGGEEVLEMTCKSLGKDNTFGEGQICRHCM